MGFWRKRGEEAKEFVGDLFSWVMTFMILFPPLGFIIVEWHESLVVRFFAWLGCVTVLIAIFVGSFVIFGSDD